MTRDQAEDMILDFASACRAHERASWGEYRRAHAHYLEEKERLIKALCIADEQSVEKIPTDIDPEYFDREPS